MKRVIFLYWVILIGLYSCDYDKGIMDYKPDIIGGPVSEVLVSPSSGTLYIDSELPVMTYCVAPLGTLDTLVTWVSDKPEVLDVDPQTGELIWGSITNTEVTITAVSSSNENITGSCVFTIRNARGLYGYVDLRKSCGLWMIDRNLGASTNTGSWNLNFSSNKGARGDYYQWGKNEPVANMEKGGQNGEGGEWVYDNGRVLRGGYENYSNVWGESSVGFLDWSQLENQPGDWENWRLPTKEELEKLSYYMEAGNFRTAAEKGEAELLRKSLYWNATAMIGYYTAYNDHYWDYQYNGVAGASTCYIWSSDRDPENPSFAYALEITQGGSAIVLQPISAAAPIRLVCEATNFDEGWLGDSDEESENDNAESEN